MADPLTLGVIALGAGTAMSAVGQLRAGQQASQAEKYNAAVAEANARSIRESAAFESDALKKQSAVEQAKIEREKKSTISSQRAAYAKAGVRLDEGSPLEVMADTASQYELDLATERYNLSAGLEKLRYESETGIARSQSEADYRKQLAKSYKDTSYINAGSTLLTGGYGVSKAVGYGAKK